MSIFNVFNKCTFRKATHNDIELIQSSFSETLGCDFIPNAVDYLESTEDDEEESTYNIYLLFYEQTLIGIEGVMLVKPNIYYIDFRCTASKNILNTIRIFQNKSLNSQF